MEEIINQIRQTLRENTDEKTIANGKNFFKEEIKTYGVKTPVAQRIGRDYLKKIKHLPKVEIFALCEQLWQSGMLEESFIACNWSYALREQYTPDDFEVFDRWVNRYVSNWASCDTLCNHTVGDFVMMYPEFVARLKQWARSENRWTKRAAAVTLIIPARKGLFLSDIFEIAETLLTDPDDLVQKGYGWMLKAASERYPQEIFDYVVSKKAVMPRTAYRYAIEKLSPELRRKAMSKD
ncbi:DNA alkylation repair protein [Alistipes sp. OttesenSCG-928-L06]|nr:DNA alkylation repair protein [Alistipes sp. OttesenSCG-928-L06]